MNQLYKGAGDGSFREVTFRAGVFAASAAGQAAADFDNDGDLDWFVFDGNRGMLVYENKLIDRGKDSGGRELDPAEAPRRQARERYGVRRARHGDRGRTILCPRGRRPEGILILRRSRGPHRPGRRIRARSM